MFNDKDMEFDGSIIWKDVYPYKIEKHSDRDLIKASIQIYLNDNPFADLSTKFLYNDTIISPPYKANSGYLTNNRAKLEHWMTTDIPKDFERYSLYVIWK